MTMPGKCRGRTTRVHALLAGASTLALLLAAGGMMGVGTRSALAACDTTAPSTGDTVTCDAVGTETDPIIAPASEDVTVNFLPGAVLQTTTSPAISLGGGALIDMDTATITDVDPAAIPVVIDNVIASDFTDILDRQDFLDLFGEIEATPPVVVTRPDATIELGLPSDVAARDTALHEITAVVTVQKAKMSDQAMNAITQYVTSSYDPNYGLPTSDPVSASPGTNQVIISGGTIVAGGAAAIRAAGDSATRVLVTGGGTIASLAQDAPAISMGEDSALHVVLGELQSTTPSGGTIFTAADGAAGIDAGRDASALAVYLLGDSHITTTGDNAAAIIGPGTSSVMAFEARGGLATDGRPMIATFGDNSAGVFMHGTESSTATLHIRDLYETAFGPGMQTNGDNSSLFDIDLGESSSISFVASSSTLGTFGDGSGVIRLLEADSSDVLTLLDNVTLTSSGDDSTLFESATGFSSVSSLVAIGFDLDAVGNGSGGIIQRVVNGGGNSADTSFLGNGTIDTQGANASAFLLEQGGGSSVRTVVVDASDFSTLGESSHGFYVGGLGDGSALEVTMSDVTIATVGNGSRGLFVGDIGANSASTTSLLDLGVATVGDDATAASIGGAIHSGSVNSVDIARSSFDTEGDRSAGLIVPGLIGVGGDGVFVVSMSEVAASTLGADSAGIRVGDPDVDLGGPANIFSSSRSHAFLDLDVATAGDRSIGLAVYGFGDGTVNSDATTVLENSTVTTDGDDSVGVLLDVFSEGASGFVSYLVAVDVTVETAGDRATGLVVGDGLGANNTIASTSLEVILEGIDIATTGGDAVGLIVEPFGQGAANTDVVVDLGDIAVVTSGANSHGIVLGEGLGTSIAGTPSSPTPGFQTVVDRIGAGPLIVASELTLTDIAVTTSGDNAHALVIAENTTLSLAGQNHVGATTTNGTIVSGTIDSFDGLVATGAGSRAVMNHGMLYGTFTVGAGVVGNLANNGLIESAAGAGGVAVQFTGTTDDIFELQAEGVVIGSVEAGAGTDTFILGGIGAQTFDQTLIGIQYNGFELFEKAGSSTWTLANHSAVPIWEVREGELVVQNEFIDPIARGFTVYGGATLTLADTEPAAADTGADNRFEIQPGAIVNGNVFAGMGTDSFVFGGPGTASFDVALLGTQYNGFDDFEKTGVSTWTLDGMNPIAAPFLVNEGRLVNNATLENVLFTVNSGGTLAGIGTVGGLTLNTGGTLAPGNSIGTLTVTGNAAFGAGSTYEVELDDGGNAPGVNNDLVVADTATINGGAIFHVVPENGTATGATYAPSTQYTIIETAGAGDLTVNGAPTITDSFAFLSFTGHDDGQNYYLTSSAVAASFCLAGASFNQCSAGEAVRDLGPGHLAFDEAVGMSEADANAAFNALSGEIHASGQHVIDQTFSLFARTLRQQGAAGLGGGVAGGQVSTAPLGYSPTPRPTSLPAGVMAADTPDLPIDAYANERVAQAWLASLGGRGGIEADGNAGELDWWTAGLAGGYEGPIDVTSGNAWAGFGLGYMRSDGVVDARLSTMDADSFNIGVYGGWTDGPWSVAGSLAYSASSVSTERRVVFGGVDETANADYWSHTIGFSGEAAYGFDLANGIKVSPLFTLDAGWSGHGGFTETGAGALNLAGASESWTRLDTGLGIAVARTFVTEGRSLTLDGRAVWEHAFADVVASQSLAFAGSPTGFEVHGPDAGRDRLRLGLGLSFEATNDLTLRANYTGVFSGNQQSHGASLGFTVRF